MDTSDPDITTLRDFVRRTRRERAERLTARLEKARSDFVTIVYMVVSEFDPEAVYQWGSLLEGGHFQEISDIDLAVSGVLDARTFLRLCGRAQELSEIPVHVVQMETVEPAYAASIRKRGRIVYERQVR